MEFRKTTSAEINGIMRIIGQGQDYLRKQGIAQWQNGYPSVEIIENDMSRGYGYVLVENKNVLGTVAVVFDGDRNYDVIKGKWLSNADYAAVHRIAVESNHKGLGLASVMIKHIEKMCRQRNVGSLKVDTHEKNFSMQKLLKKNGFTYCGIIYLDDGSERIAFEKLV